MRWEALAAKAFMIGFVYASAAASSPPRPQERPTPLAEGGKKVMCSYLSYGARHYVCGEPPIADVKKKCEEKGSKEHGEKITCACTDDPSYIRDTCG